MPLPPLRLAPRFLLTMTTCPRHLASSGLSVDAAWPLPRVLLCARSPITLVTVMAGGWYFPCLQGLPFSCTRRGSWTFPGQSSACCCGESTGEVLSGLGCARPGGQGWGSEEERLRLVRPQSRAHPGARPVPQGQ